MRKVISVSGVTLLGILVAIALDKIPQTAVIYLAVAMVALWAVVIGSILAWVFSGVFFRRRF